ncbi:MAG: TonB-dependent receptor, partial [Flavobacteriaceae bacterium]
KISIEGASATTLSNNDGHFTFVSTMQGEQTLRLESPEFSTRRVPLVLEEGTFIDLGPLYLEVDFTIEKADNLIILAQTELDSDEATFMPNGWLQAMRDVFLSRAAFDFGQAFFRVRGYDANRGVVLLNGVPMNKMLDGRPQWNHWGGLNDVVRNQEFTNGLAPSDFVFGGVLGNTNIDMRPSRLRDGFRFTTSASNRTYTGRVMASYNSGVDEKGLSYMISASRRWGKQGYMEGTLYDAHSLFGSLEYRLDSRNVLLFTSIYALNRRGRASAITEEVFDLVGKRYNPYWGYQNGKIRNARERRIAEPFFQVNHYFSTGNLQWNTSVAHQFGKHGRSRLGYYNAPNPDPTYYRYLPSFYINSPIGGNFESANTAKKAFLANPQMNWSKIYTANHNTSSYVLYDDMVNENRFMASSTANVKLGDYISLDTGFHLQSSRSKNYAVIVDLFGVKSHRDIDPFSNTRNDLDSAIEKGEDDIFNYHYRLNAMQWNTFGQIRMDRSKWAAFVAFDYWAANYQREGIFRNERFVDSSLGKGERLTFSGYGLKGGATYKITGRHWTTVNALRAQRPPTVRNSFVNPRENNQVVPMPQLETITSIDANYFIRMPNILGRLTGYHTRFQNTTDINFFYIDSGLGSDFVQEVLTDFDKLHMGVELGVEYQVSSSVKLTSVMAFGKYLYANDPRVAINFDPGVRDGQGQQPIDPTGTVDLGYAKIKGLKLGQGPQTAVSMGIEYRDPNYWWIGGTMNYLSDNYAQLSPILRTESFYLNPETGEPFPDATPENVNRLLAQRPLDSFYLLNLIGGKSWMRKGLYVSVFASINNLFDASFRTGGYEQARNGNYGQMYQDKLS